MTLLGWGIGLILGGGVAAIIFRNRPGLADALFRGLIVAGCILAVLPAFATLSGAEPLLVAWQSSLPGGPWAIGLDALSAWFLVVIACVGAPTAVYGATYLGHERSHRAVAFSHATFALLLTAMIGVVIAQAAVFFLLAWEIMAVSAYLLVVFESERADVRRAGLIYLVLTHAGTLALFAMFLAWRGPGTDLTFQTLAAASPALPLGGAVILGLALIGFGVKAGVVPLHFWLPGAHAAAPSHVSALLSGVMIKTGIYGLLRVMNLLGPLPAWWGWTLLLLGLGSGVLGVLWALAQHDLKRLLAYHSVENIGIILLGLGVGALGITYRQPALAVLGFTGAVLHTLNHALFKSLLFLGAGAVLRATGTRAIDQLGGLGRQMPLTALAFLVGSAAIVGLPPLNGFISEWVVFQALLRTGDSVGTLRLAIVAAAGLGLIGGLALACFTKVDGVVFLGQPRSRVASQARERSIGSIGPMFLLAAACVALGLFPGLAVVPGIRVGILVAGASRIGPGPVSDLVAALPSATGLALAVVCVSALLWVARHDAGRRLPAAKAGTWACAGGPISPRMQYTASSYAAPLLATLEPIASVHEDREAASFHTHPVDLVLDTLVLPSWQRLGRLAREARIFQAGRLRWYLLYVVFTLLALLAYLGYTTATL